MFSLSELSTKKLHFIGIGGAGMSGLARIALTHGAHVSGSDEKDSSVLAALAALGAKVFSSHDASHIDGADLVIYSNAISKNNPERVQATQLGIPLYTRAQALALLMSESISIAVAGTHGKTTTSSMLTVALQACGVDPSFAIGGTLSASGSNAHRGTGKYFVAEADESDGSFVEYKPFGAIVTNVELQHLMSLLAPSHQMVFWSIAQMIWARANWANQWRKFLLFPTEKTLIVIYALITLNWPQKALVLVRCGRGRPLGT